MKTLSDVLPPDFLFMEFEDCQARKFSRVAVKYEHNSLYEKWPGPSKFVFFWVTLENGYCVGWNENPSKGWSFPTFKIKQTF